MLGSVELVVRVGDGGWDEVGVRVGGGGWDEVGVRVRVGVWVRKTCYDRGT